MKFLKCHRLKSIKFSSLIKAKLIEVELNDDLERVELEASNLCRVVISQTKQCEINLLSCNNLRMLTLSAPNCREFNQNPNIWETKQIEKTHTKENNHTHKTIFTWLAICLHPRSCRDFTIIRENTIVHKNTLKKSKSQYTLTLSHPQDKKTLFFFLCCCC